MFFLLRTAFWLSLVILLIPADASSDAGDQPNISTLQALGAAQQTYTDMTRFCERNQIACQTGGAALEMFSSKARNGARMVYQYLDSAGDDDTATNTTRADTTRTGSISTSGTARPLAVIPHDADAASVDHGTLSPRDRQPAWMPPLPSEKPV